MNEPAKVLAFPENNDTPHNAGKARCMTCGHEWVAVAPVGTFWFECGECHSMKGHYIYHCSPTRGLMWTCNCGGIAFGITKDETFCLNCSATQAF